MTGVAWDLPKLKLSSEEVYAGLRGGVLAASGGQRAGTGACCGSLGASGGAVCGPAGSRRSRSSRADGAAG